MFPEPTIAVQHTDTATTSNNGSTSSNNCNSCITINNPVNTVNSSTRETPPVPPSMLSIETDDANPANDIDDITILQENATIDQENATIDQDPTGGVTTDHSNLATLPSDTNAGTSMDNPVENLVPMPKLKHECFVSVKKLDEETILKFTATSGKQSLWNTTAVQNMAASSSVITLRPRSSGCTRSLRYMSKAISYANMDTDSNEEHEKTSKRKPKIRPSAEPSKSCLTEQEFISKQCVQKTDSDSSNSTTEVPDSEHQLVDENDNKGRTDKKSSSNSTPKGSFVTTHHRLPTKLKCVSQI